MFSLTDSQTHSQTDTTVTEAYKFANRSLLKLTLPHIIDVTTENACTRA